MREISVNIVQAGDVVMGTLPVHLVAEINTRGARYIHLELPAEARDGELSADDLDALDAKLVEYRAEAAGGMIVTLWVNFDPR